MQMGKQIDMHCSLIKIGAQILGSAVRLQGVPDPMSKAGYAERIAPPAPLLSGDTQIRNFKGC